MSNESCNQRHKIESGEIRKDNLRNPWPSILKFNHLPALYKREIKRTTLLNTLVDKFNYQSYLEIGQGHKEDNFRWIDCPHKIGVDPDESLNAAFQMTSDEFFAQNEDSFDLIFIDGLHLARQVEIVILNCV